MNYETNQNSIKILSEHISVIQNRKTMLIEKKKETITKLTDESSSNVERIEELISALETKESAYNVKIHSKQCKLVKLSSDIAVIQAQVLQIKKKNNDSYQQMIQSLNARKNMLSASFVEFNKKKTMNYYPNKYCRRANAERKRMIDEEYKSTKRNMISLTSKIESHSEFVASILKSKSILSSSLERLNEIPLNPALDELSAIDYNKLGEYLYSYGKDELNITIGKESFIQNILLKYCLDEVINYIIQQTKSELPRNLFEYLIMAIGRIITYEKVLETRMKFVQDITDQHNKALEMNENQHSIHKELEEIDNEIEKINKDKRDNNDSLLQMQSDLNVMLDYSKILTIEIDKINKELLDMQKDLLMQINRLKADNVEILAKIDMKKNKMIKMEEELNREIEALISLKNDVSKEKDEVLISKTRTNTQTITQSTINQQSPPQFFYPITMNKNDLMLSEKIAPLLKGTTILKRSIIHIKKKIYESYIPIYRNHIINPLDWNFRKCFVLIDDKMTKIIFQKLTPLEKNLEIALTSLSRMEVPLVTKSLVFIKRLYDKLKNNIQLKSKDEIDNFICNNQNKVIELYNKSNKNKSSSYDFDEKILNKEYRNLLIEANKYLLYVYLKPDEDTKIELLFEAYDDFKVWINGLEEVINNSKAVCEIIKHFLI